jgi:UDP-3-O-[3-hydroxymyristoyl] glucosamine N-acyltransferase
MQYLINPVTADKLAQDLGLELSSEAKSQVLTAVTGINEISHGCLSYLTNKKSQPGDGVIITKPEWAKHFSHQKFIYSENPRYDFARALTLLTFKETVKESFTDSTAQISEHAIVDSTCKIGANVRIGPGAIIGPYVSIGAGTVVSSGVKIFAGSQIGQNCYIDMGAVIGSEGFGFEKNTSGWLHLRHLGSVQMGDDCYIGALTTIDRGFLKNTSIGHGVKIDNHCQVAHNVSIGDNTLIAGFSAIAGSTQIGVNCVLGGNVSIRDHVMLADGVVVTGGSSVAADLNKGVYSSGMHAIENRKWLRNHRQMLQLNDVLQRIEGKLND